MEKCRPCLRRIPIVQEKLSARYLGHGKKIKGTEADLCSLKWGAVPGKIFRERVSWYACQFAL
jgi:hypothetical protein